MAQWAEVAGERRLAELRDRRLARKLTQAALAKELGVTSNAVARWERCKRPIPHWVAPHLATQLKIAELTSALAEKDAKQKELRGTIEAKNFELQVEKAIRKASPSAARFNRRRRASSASAAGKL